MENEKKFISETDGLHEGWYKEAQEMKRKDLMAFIDRLTNEYSHSQGTICHAMVAGALATLAVMNETSEGHIGPNQAYNVLGLFIRKWAKLDGPQKLTSWFGLLNLKNGVQFVSVPDKVFEEVQKVAEEMLRGDLSKVDPIQVQHLSRIAAGQVPFGLKLESELLKGNKDEQQG